MKSFKIIIALVLVWAFGACSNQEAHDIFDTTPSERMEQAKTELEQTLVSHTNGWELIYFPNVQELFSDKDKNVVQSVLYRQFLVDLTRKHIGTGGYYFLMKFLKDGKVQMLSDENNFTSSHIKESEYSISQNSFLQLSFITPNYIFGTKQTAFLFYKKQEDGSLVFTTNRYEDESREYIVLRPLKADESDLKAQMQKVFQTKLNFERNIIDAKPTLTIYDDFQNIVFQTKPPQNNGQYTKSEKRYALFMKNISPDPTKINTHFIGLGSGYIIPESGKVVLLPGIKWNREVIFKEFEQNGRQYISKVNGYTAIIQ